MKNKAIFLDRDGTINIDKNYLYKKEEFEYLPGALQGLKNLTDANFLLFIITNQSGIARGFYSEADFLSLTEWMTKDLKSRGIKIEKVYFCPHLNEHCNCRKPKTALFHQAIKEFDIDIKQSYAVGDKELFFSIFNETDCKGIVLYSSENSVKQNIVYITGGLEDARNKIL